MKEQNAELAISDIEFIRTILDNDQRHVPDRTELAIHLLVAGVSIVFLLALLFVFPDISQDLILSQTNGELRFQILVQSGLILAVVGAGVYALAYLRAKELQSTLQRTLNRHFDFLKLETFLPDLALKAFVLVVEIVAKQPQLLAPTLVAFTADYALQGRFFRLPRTVRIATGVVLYILAVTMITQSITNVLYAIGAFAFVSCASLATVALKQRAK